MRQTVKLRTSEGDPVSIVLENWGSGLDRLMRRWVLVEDYWECVDTGSLAEESCLRELKTYSALNPEVQLSHPPVADRLRALEMAIAQMRGQTMVEYALIIAAISVVAWGAYSIMGHDIGSMASGIDSSLTST
jgi:Flp pilus assembly pilin Flp